MKVIDLLNVLTEDTLVNIMHDDEVLAWYNGKDSITGKWNDYHILGVEADIATFRYCGKPSKGRVVIYINKEEYDED